MEMVRAMDKGAQEMGKDERWIEEQIAKFNKVSDNYIVVKQ